MKNNILIADAPKLAVSVYFKDFIYKTRRRTCIMQGRVTKRPLFLGGGGGVGP